MEGKAHDLIKDVLQKITANVVLNYETVEVFPHNQEKFKNFQYHLFCLAQSFSQHNKTRGEYKMYKGRKGRNNLSINCR